MANVSGKTLNDRDYPFMHTNLTFILSLKLVMELIFVFIVSV